MMANLIVHNYYYRYREQRKQIKNLVDSSNHIQAIQKLQQTIAEYNQKYTDEILNQRPENDFNRDEKLILNHALEHLTSFNETNQENQKIITSQVLDNIPENTG